MSAECTRGPLHIIALRPIVSFMREGLRRCWLRSRRFRPAHWRLVRSPDLRKEAVAAPRNGFHKARTFRGISQGVTDFIYRFVEPVIEVHESVRRPQLFLQLFASYHLASSLQQHRQDLEGLFLQPDAQAMFAQFSSAKIHLKNSETESAVGLMVFLHGEVDLSRGRVYTRRQISGRLQGRVDPKLCIQCQLPRDVDSSDKELRVHCNNI